MKNIIKIYTDSVNVYATIQINASATGIRVLSVLVMLSLIFLVVLLSKIKPEEIPSMAIPIVLMLIFMIGMPIKYLLWNRYGQEFLVVNTKSVSWSYDYGIIKTNLKTKTFDKLGIGYEAIRSAGENETGRLIFYDYNAKNNLPVIIHQTTALLSRKDLELLNNKVKYLFAIEFNTQNGFVPYSNN
ncbi:MAG: hypothetical protein U0U46_12335 [Saprospiraceae bacterium]